MPFPIPPPSANPAVRTRAPRIGLLGIMQPLYDDMIPGITERQAAYAARVAERLAGVAEWTVAPPVRGRADAESAMRAFEADGLDGVMIVMLTYGPSLRVTRALSRSDLPLALANIQPDPAVTAEWDMDDMTYNQGIHGAQDTANALVRADTPFEVITGEWRSPDFAARVDRWARAARAVSDLRRLRVGVFGYPMNGMGDARVDETALLRRLGPEVHVIAPGALHRTMADLPEETIRSLMEWEDRSFRVDERLSKEEREDHARMQSGIERLLEEAECGAYSTHFDAIGEDGRFARLPMAAASTLMAQGYGFAGEGDVLAASIVYAGHRLAGDGHFTEMYAMDFPGDSILMSHMGEGNWRVAREDEPIRLIKRPLGIGGLGDPPTILFRYRPGPATLASLVSLGGERFRLVVAEGEVLDSPELPSLEMPYGRFRPVSGVRDCMDAWLRAGGTHHMVMNTGHRAEDWRVLCRLVDIEHVRV
ncbi:L-fucose/L-arabinose isomerase family protein [Nocardiopsis lambiniae]|uniref:L-fucose/L-arabinose isomerase family protein n=1 Tax=Nocardiopsis lambiniae TaxID=3075539 RepID=A0ABU2M9M6_9ACTN|nr:L-fucose/L-arabinose isomerase family protein [Nocardiopsis sp. DSM 44743]MDT0329354.1 L-fucose/L-arabinose isomerase family protein [Nocardiopsis sp. DSM 44743]